MTVVLSIVVFLHIVGAAMIVGPWIANMKNPTVGARQFDGAMTQLVTGIILVGLITVLSKQADSGIEPLTANTYVKLTFKFIIAIVVGALAFVGNRRRKAGEPVAPGLAHAVGGLGLLNIAIATIWP
ncbi:hypothetical protein SPF06_05870 [Sinomonas sp. JGH33]|uniref:Integral membrane protein n=1 Tax=Sinomonas terricola TaxID=3110330 RepID=A0ABU5T3K6_9MICC|nr:hypothetical protein [Sinomonas sp. JGH33]MEA5454248.1 hypothetical protein [Sinomonas sp. JGH33]